MTRTSEVEKGQTGWEGGLLRVMWRLRQGLSQQPCGEVAAGAAKPGLGVGWGREVNRVKLSSGGVTPGLPWATLGGGDSRT